MKTRTSKAIGAVAGIAAIAAVGTAGRQCVRRSARRRPIENPYPDLQGPGCDAFKAARAELQDLSERARRQAAREHPGPQHVQRRGLGWLQPGGQHHPGAGERPLRGVRADRRGVRQARSRTARGAEGRPAGAVRASTTTTSSSACSAPTTCTASGPPSRAPRSRSTARAATSRSTTPPRCVCGAIQAENARDLHRSTPCWTSRPRPSRSRRARRYVDHVDDHHDHYDVGDAVARAAACRRRPDRLRLERSQAEVAADDLLHDLGRAAEDRLDRVRRRSRGRRGTPSCSRSRRAAARSWSTTFLAVSVHHHFALAASTAVSSPSTTPCRQRSTYCSVTSSSVSISAIRNRLCWKLPIGWPNALRSLAYCSVWRQVSRAPAIAEIAIESRSDGRFCIRW